MLKQSLILPKDMKLAKPYSVGPYNKTDGKEQWIRLSEGCPHQHPYCYEPATIHLYPVPDITCNTVKIIDMNLLCKPEALQIIRDLGTKRVNGKFVYYELICGADYRFLTDTIAHALKNSRFTHMRLAWDLHYADQFPIRNALTMLYNAGYKPKDLMLFMICNWRIPYEECVEKLDLCKVWNVQVADCYYDNQTSPHIIPIHWTGEQIKSFRKKCRVHNILVNFGFDPELKKRLNNRDAILSMMKNE